jgi:hypothetical protein
MADGIAPIMTNNQAIRRILSFFQDDSGNPMPGAPGGSLEADSTRTYRHTATGPSPIVAWLIAPANSARKGGFLTNLDAAITIYYGSDPAITDATGGTLLAGQSVPINIRGPLYVYCLTGAPIAEFVEAYVA